MKSKTLISLAIASTFGWSAASFAGTGHEVVTPFSPNESGENVFMQKEGFGSSTHLSSIGSTSIDAGGTVSGSSELGFDSAAMGEHWMGEGLALGDEGVYSDYYIVSWTPMASESWDYYVIDTGSDGFASAGDVYFLTPTYDILVFEDMSGMSNDLGE
jgi:hypothetical protein